MTPCRSGHLRADNEVSSGQLRSGQVRLRQVTTYVVWDTRVNHAALRNLQFHDVQVAITAAIRLHSGRCANYCCGVDTLNVGSEA